MTTRHLCHGSASHGVDRAADNAAMTAADWLRLLACEPTRRRQSRRRKVNTATLRPQVQPDRIGTGSAI